MCIHMVLCNIMWEQLAQYASHLHSSISCNFCLPFSWHLMNLAFLAFLLLCDLNVENLFICGGYFEFIILVYFGFLLSQLHFIYYKFMF